MKWNHARGRWGLVLLAALLMFIDRLSKLWALSSLAGAQPKTGIPGIFRFVFTCNEGAAFSMLAGSPFVVSVLSGLILLLLGTVILCGRTLDHMTRLCLTAIWAGGVGNLIDRVIYGAVVDFIDLTFISFPIFNVADICVTVGALIFAARLFIPEKKGDAQK